MGGGVTVAPGQGGAALGFGRIDTFRVRRYEINPQSFTKKNKTLEIINAIAGQDTVTR